MWEGDWGPSLPPHTAPPEGTEPQGWGQGIAPKPPSHEEGKARTDQLPGGGVRWRRRPPTRPFHWG